MSPKVRSAFEMLLQPEPPFPPPTVRASSLPRPKGCLVYLATHDEYVDAVAESLRTVERFFFAHHGRYPVLVFVTDAVSGAARERLLASSSEVDLSFVDHPMPSSLCPDPAGGVCWHNASLEVPDGWLTCKTVGAEGQCLGYVSAACA